MPDVKPKAETQGNAGLSLCQGEVVASNRRNKAFGGGYYKTNISAASNGQPEDSIGNQNGGGIGKYPACRTEILARNSNSRGSQEDGERTIEEYGKETFPNSTEERQICENIFDWWISGKSYERWYADKFLQGKLFDDE